MDKLMEIPDYEYSKLSENALNSFTNISLKKVCEKIIIEYKELLK